MPNLNTQTVQHVGDAVEIVKVMHNEAVRIAAGAGRTDGSEIGSILLALATVYAARSPA